MRRLALMCAACLLMTVSVSWAAGVRPGPAQQGHIQGHKTTSATAAKTAVSRHLLLGTSTVGSARSAAAAGAARAFAFRARRSGTASTVSLYLGRASAASAVSAGLYRDNHGSPGSRIGQASIGHPRGGAWNAAKITRVGLTAGRMYWVAVLARGGRVVLAGTNRTACNSPASGRAHLSRLPGAFRGHASSGPCHVSAFISGQTGAAGGSASGTALGAVGTVSPTFSGNRPVTATGTGSGLFGGALLPPINTGAPTIKGTAAWGQSLTISKNGSWLNSPTGYRYQWQDCGTLAISCTNIAGATGSSHVVGAGDVGSTIRVVVTASNSAGGTSAASATTGTVPTPPAPSAAFSFSPAAPQTNQTVNFDGAKSACGATPCSYSWADDPPGGGSFSLGSGPRITFAFTGAGTKYVVLTVTDGMNRTASVEHNVVVTNATPPSPPTNSSPPTISGTAQQGQTLTASPGTWTGSPTSYAYQWQDCNALGSSCSSIAGATASSYRVAGTDVGDTIRVAVEASNAGGSATATSSQTSVVTAGSTGSTLNCFSAPGACGYPDPSYGNVGVANCSALPTWSPSDLPSGSYYYSGSGNTVDITASNVTIKGYNIGNWQLYGNGVSNFTLDGDCLSYSGNGTTGSISVWSTGSGETIENSTIIAPGCTASAMTICRSSGVTETLISGGPNSTVRNNILAGAVEPINGLGAGSVIQDNFIVANGFQNGAHSEDIYESQVAGITIDHNTLLNPFDQTATIFGDTLGHPCQNQFTVTNNLMAGGGYIIYSCASSTGAGTSKLVFTGNDIARCGGTSTYDSSLGGHYCGSTGPSSTGGASVGAGADSHGYWPLGGFFGLASSTYCSGGDGVTWSGNYWDDTGASIACP